MNDDALLQWMDDSPSTDADAVAAPPWRVLVVDDDADVHETTAFALDRLEVAGRMIELLHAYSGAQGQQLLQQEPDIAVVLLDVVMETDDAGLRLVEAIRGPLGLAHLRIILRTGQPGQAPEFDTIRAYDINDYKTKGELTRNRLYASLTTALRSYDQLKRLDASRRGLEQIVAASHQFIAEQGMQAFAEGVITQIAALLGVSPEGVVCASLSEDAASGGADYIVIAAAGRFRHLIQSRIEDIEEPHIARSLERCLSERSTLVDGHSVTLFFPGNSHRDFAAYLGSRLPLAEVDQHLLEVFCTNIALCAANVQLVHRLRELAFVDRMLGVPNRTAFIERLDDMITSGALDGYLVAKLDVDQFSQTNEMLGHRYGDKLLRALYERLRAQLGEQAYVARLGGNTFGVIAREAGVSVDQLRAVFDTPFDVRGVARRLSACIGVVRSQDSAARTGAELVEDARIALKLAKSQGNGRIEHFTRVLGADARDRSRLLQGLHRAFEYDRLFMVYQPKVALSTGRAVGLEALMRWRAEDGSMVPPDRFIPVAEQSGLIVALGQWALRTALGALARLDEAGFSAIQMGVNVSTVQMAQPDFIEELDRALADKQVAPQRLELEITESVAMIGLDRVAELLRAIRARGVAVAIDDFGTGFSSLSYLDQLPADRIKIDRTFVDNLEADQRGARIARLIVPLGHQLEMKVVAEGVETERQRSMLLALGCDEGQGYLFGRPMPLEELLAWLAAQPGTVSGADA